MNEVHDSVVSSLDELKSRVNTLINSDIASSTRFITFDGLFNILIMFREIAGFRSTIDGMLGKVGEISTQVGEINRNRDNNLLIHGLPTQVCKYFFNDIFVYKFYDQSPLQQQLSISIKIQTISSGEWESRHVDQVSLWPCEDKTWYWKRNSSCGHCQVEKYLPLTMIIMLSQVDQHQYRAGRLASCAPVFWATLW